MTGAVAPGVFISFEGGEGTGKSTQARLLAQALEQAGKQVVLTREPGGTPLAERIREILVGAAGDGMDSITELLLVVAARREHLQRLILPALREGRVVITDRFADATAAYQGYGRGMPPGLLRSLGRTVAGGLEPDLTVLLAFGDWRRGIERSLARHRAAGTALSEGRFESEPELFHQRVGEGYRRLAARHPRRIVVVDAGGDPETVHRRVVRAVEARLPGVLG